jgi:Cu+-exporting ATPase
VAILREMGIAVKMVTGDNKRTASAIASQAGIHPLDVHAEVLPANKVAIVKAAQAEGRVVAMVGDGINDAPALVQADLGIAIGAGTDIAVEAAGMVLVKSNLNDVVVALDLARIVFRRIMLNFCWAMGYNIILVPLSAGVFWSSLHFLVPPMYAGAAMAMSSVSVVTSRCGSFARHAAFRSGWKQPFCCCWRPVADCRCL